MLFAEQLRMKLSQKKKIVGAVDVFVQCVHKINVCLWLEFILGILMRFYAELMYNILYKNIFP
jgi:hypothetical protein